MLDFIKAVDTFCHVWITRCGLVCSCTDLFATIPEVAPEKFKRTRGLGSCCLCVLLPLTVVAEAHAKIFGSVCDLEALTVEEILCSLF